MKDIDRPTGEYRTRYLKLRSVLYDRTTGLPAFPAVIDKLSAIDYGEDAEVEI